MRHNRSQGKRHYNATINQLTKILIFLKLEKRATLSQIRINAIIPNDYVNPSLHRLVFWKMVKKFRVGRETFYSLEAKCLKK